MQSSSYFKCCQFLLLDYFDQSKKFYLIILLLLMKMSLPFAGKNWGRFCYTFNGLSFFFPPYYSFDPFTLYIKMIISNQLNPLPHAKYRHMLLLNLRMHACGDCEVMLVLWNAHLWLLRYSFNNSIPLLLL